MSTPDYTLFRHFQASQPRVHQAWKRLSRLILWTSGCKHSMDRKNYTPLTIVIPKRLFSSLKSLNKFAMMSNELTGLSHFQEPSSSKSIVSSIQVKIIFRIEWLSVLWSRQFKTFAIEFQQNLKNKSKCIRWSLQIGDTVFGQE